MPSLQLTEVAPGLTVAGARHARGMMRVVFKEAAARGPELRLSLPELNWAVLPGGEVALPWGEFMRIALRITTMDEAEAETALVMASPPSVEELSPQWEAALEAP